MGVALPSQRSVTLYSQPSIGRQDFVIPSEVEGFHNRREKLSSIFVAGVGAAGYSVAEGHCFSCGSCFIQERGVPWAFLTKRAFVRRSR